TFVLVADDDPSVVLFESIPCETRDSIVSLLDFALVHGADDANWRPMGGFHDLVRRCPGKPPESIGATTGAAPLEAVVAAFRAVAEAEGCHVIEHVLLRKRQVDDPFLPVQLNPEGDCTCIDVCDPYSFRVTVLLPSWPAR